MCNVLLKFKPIGIMDLSPPTLRLSQLIGELLPSEPVLLITSPGADPSEELRTLAYSTVGENRYHEVKKYLSFN